MEEVLADYVSKDSVAASHVRAGEETGTSSHLGEVGSEPALEVAAIIGVGEEEEDKDRDTHFKWKRRLPYSVISPFASPQKKVKQIVSPSSRRVPVTGKTSFLCCSCVYLCD